MTVGSFLLPKGEIFILLALNLLAKPVVKAVSSSIEVEAGDVWLSPIWPFWEEMALLQEQLSFAGTLLLTLCREGPVAVV